MDSKSWFNLRGVEGGVGVAWSYLWSWPAGTAGIRESIAGVSEPCKGVKSVSEGNLWPLTTGERIETCSYVQTQALGLDARAST